MNLPADPSTRPALSPEGHARRARMLDELRGAVRARGRRRRATRAGATGVAAVLLLAGALVVMRAQTRTPGADEPRLARFETPAPTPLDRIATLRHVRFDRVDQPTTRVVTFASPPTGRAEPIRDDAELLALLHEAGVDTGLVRINGELSFTNLHPRGPTPDPDPSPDQNPETDPAPTPTGPEIAA